VENVFTRIGTLHKLIAVLPRIPLWLLVLEVVHSYFVMHKAAHNVNTLYKDTLQYTKYVTIKSVTNLLILLCISSGDTVTDEANESHIFNRTVRG